MSATNKQGKMAGYINYRMKVTLLDSREMQGQLLAFDMHMNLVLADTEEFRKLRRRKVVQDDDEGGGVEEIAIHEEKRTLGLTIIRGAQVVSVEAISPPAQDPSARLGKSAPGGLPSLPTGPGISRPAGRGALPVPSSLAGPAAGIGGAPPGFPGIHGGGAPGFPGRGAPSAFPPQAGFPGAPGAPGQFPPSYPGFPGGPGGPPPPGFQPPQRR